MGLTAINRSITETLNKYGPWGRVIFLVFFTLVCSAVIAASLEMVAQYNVKNATDEYIASLNPPEHIDSKRAMAEELADLKNTVQKMREADAATSWDKIAGEVTLVITALTLIVSIAVPLCSLEFILNLLNRAGNEIAGQTGELVQAELTRSQALILLLLQFEREKGWERKPTVDHACESQLLAYGEKALEHSIKQEALLKAAEFKCDFSKQFPSCTSDGMRNNLLFSLSLMNSFNAPSKDRKKELDDLRREKADRALTILREMETRTPESGSAVLTEVRAEINYFDLWYPERAQRIEKLEGLRAKFARAQLRLQTEQPVYAKALMSAVSVQWCRGRINHIDKLLKDDQLKLESNGAEFFLSIEEARNNVNQKALDLQTLTWSPWSNEWRPLSEFLN